MLRRVMVFGWARPILFVFALFALLPSAYAFTYGQAAAVVLGQSGFTTHTPATTQSGMNFPASAVTDSDGRLWVADSLNNRVLRFDSSAHKGNGAAADGVLGQSDFTTATSAATQSGMQSPLGVTIDSAGTLWVADSLNNRVLRFDNAASKPNGANADGVLGQSNFTTTTSDATQGGMDIPRGVAIDSAGTLWVADALHGRVLRFDNAASKVNGANADGVLGQSDFTTTTPAATQNGMRRPYGVATDSAGRLWVSDDLHNRVLRFDNAASKPNGANADGVLGQSDFTTTTSATTQSGMFSPGSIVVDNAGSLWLADTLNARVLGFANAASKPNGANADGVLGQSDFTTRTSATTQSGMLGVGGVAIDNAGHVWVVDNANSRVLRFDVITTPSVTWANPAAITYGTPLDATQLNASASVPGTFSYNPPAGTLLQAGNNQTLAVIFTPDDTLSYATTTATVTINVAKASQTITFDAPGAKTYGNAAFTLHATASSGLPVSFSLVSGPATLENNSVTITGAGAVVVQASQPGNTNFNAVPPVERSFIIAPALLTISADNKVRYVNTANPPLTASYSGFVNGDDMNSLTSPAVLATTATINSPVGSYAIIVSGASSANYTPTFVPGTLSVTPFRVYLSFVQK
jgi:sugar lactone lactonase YvrE